MCRPLLLLLVGIIASTAALVGAVFVIANRGAGVRLEPDELAARWQQAHARVSFTVRPTTTSGEAPEGQAALYIFRGVVRLDLLSGTGESTVIIVPFEGPGNDNIFDCSSTEQHCTGAGSDPLLYAFFIPLLNGPAWLTGGTSNRPEIELRAKDSNRRIAGHETRCFLRSWEAVGGRRKSAELSNDELAGSTEVCYTADAVPLAYNFSVTDNQGTSGLRFEATSVSGDVSSSDIQPPYPTAGFVFTPTPREAAGGTATAAAANDRSLAGKALLALSDFPPGWRQAVSSSADEGFHGGAEPSGEGRTALAASPFFLYTEGGGSKTVRHAVALYSTQEEAAAACAEDRLAEAVTGQYSEIMGGRLGINVTRFSAAPLTFGGFGDKSSAYGREIDFTTDAGAEAVAYTNFVYVADGRSCFLVSANRYSSPFDGDELAGYVGKADWKASDAQGATTTQTLPARGGVTVLALVAQNIEFDKTSLEAPAGAITIKFENRDNGIPHGFHLFEGTSALGKDAGAIPIFVGPATNTLTVNLTPGKYLYRCDVHPTTMTGTLTVTGAATPASSTTPQRERASPRSVLVDATHDGGVWWYPQAFSFDPSAPHQGKQLAEYLRSGGASVLELPRTVGGGESPPLPGTSLSAEFLAQFDLVIRMNGFGPYAPSELQAYQDFVRAGGRLLLLTGYQRGAETDALASAFGLEFRGITAGTTELSDFVPHAITQGLRPLAFGVGSGLVSNPPDAEILGRLSSSSYLDLNGDEIQQPDEPSGPAVLGVMHVGAGRIAFMGSVGLLLNGDVKRGQDVSQPLTDNIVRWLAE